MARRPRRSRRPSQQADGADDQDWIATYADAITLLMAFFVVLYSISEIREDRFTAVRASIAEALTGSGQEIKKDDELGKADSFDLAMSQLEQRLSELVSNGTLEVSNVPKGIVLEFSSRTLYSVGSADILPASKPLLNRIADRINSLGNSVSLTVTVEGHTDDSPISTVRFPSNWELSTARATNIVRHLVSRNVNPKLLRAAGYADMKPKVPNLDSYGMPLPKNRAKNRRVVIKLERY